MVPVSLRGRQEGLDPRDPQALLLVEGLSEQVPHALGQIRHRFRVGEIHPFQPPL